MSEPVLDFDPFEDVPEDEDGQLQLLEPWEDGLDFGAWVASMPRDDQYRSLRWAGSW